MGEDPGAERGGDTGRAGAAGRGAQADGLQDALEWERAYIRHAEACLSRMAEVAVRAAADAAERAPGDWDATVAHRHLVRRVESMEAGRSPLCFGRIDEEAGATWHIGRRHVEDRGGTEVVVDWRAPVAVPFYRATFRDPLHLDRRRRFLLDGGEISDLLDEDFSDPESAEHLSSSGLPDPLLAELGRSRTGLMQDIVATIAAEQDQIIRAPIDRTVVVQGGPGTGKTAVGLHRAAFLLYEHRARLERQGLLVLGPSRVFLSYISQVLPSLGEVAVTQTTVPGLVPAWVEGTDEGADAARVKGDLRMVEVVRRSAESVVRPPDGPLTGTTRWGSVTVPADELVSLLDEVLASGGPFGLRRTRFRRSVVRRMAGLLSDRRRRVADIEDVSADLNVDRSFSTQLNRMWPSQGPIQVVRRLLGRSAVRASIAGSILDRAELTALGRSLGGSTGTTGGRGGAVGGGAAGGGAAGGAVAGGAAEWKRARRAGGGGRVARGRPLVGHGGGMWTRSEIPLLDEAEWFLNGPPRRYGHVVVDEAQDLSPMALRMIARRVTRDGSLTVLGDLAQATTPGAVADWDQALGALARDGTAQVEVLTIGYRVPAPIMDRANTLLPAFAPGLAPTRSVRQVGEPPRSRSVSRDALSTTAVREARTMLATWPTVGVIAPEDHLDQLFNSFGAGSVPVTRPGGAPESDRVTLLRPADAKGLEFDAVVVVEPSALGGSDTGLGMLYIAMTRAVQELSIVHASPLPPELARESIA